MINFRFVIQQLELTFWSAAIELMSLARRWRMNRFLPVIRLKSPPIRIWHGLALSMLGLLLGFTLGFGLL